MAKKYNLTTAFTTITETSGTIQNVGAESVELVSSTNAVAGEGIVLNPGEKRSFKGSLSARSIGDAGADVNVVDFTEAGEGGEYTPMYVPVGSVAFASLPTTLTKSMLGWTYNVTDAFVTDSRFIEGADVSYPAGQNVVVVEPSAGVYKYDCFAGAYVLPVASDKELGGIKISNSFTVSNDGTLNIKKAGKTILGAVKSSDDEGKVMVNNDATMTYNPLGYRQPFTTYEVGDIKYHSALPTGWHLECTTPGTSSSGDLTITSPAIGGTVTDGTVTWTVRKMESTEYRSRVIVDSAAAHNAIYRGKDLTAYFNSGEMSAAIADGSFRNIYPGDYITKSITIDGTTYSNVKFIVMDLDYHLHCGDTETTAHHVVIMPEEVLGYAQMNTEHTTVGGYLGSKMWTEHMPKVTAGFEAAFGAAHILEHRELLSNTMDANVKSNAFDAWNGAVSNWTWVSVKANLANENMVYGAPVVSSSSFDTGECNSQLAAFRLNHGLICSKRHWWWLRSVAGASYFCFVNYSGDASTDGAAASFGVRPIALLC